MPRFKGPRTQCGSPVMPKHLPHCTPRRRKDGEGCWCFLHDGRRPSTREWRSRRRGVVRSDRAWFGWKPTDDMPSWNGHCYVRATVRVQSWKGLNK